MQIASTETPLRPSEPTPPRRERTSAPHPARENGQTRVRRGQAVQHGALTSQPGAPIRLPRRPRLTAGHLRPPPQDGTWHRDATGSRCPASLCPALPVCSLLATGERACAGAESRLQAREQAGASHPATSWHGAASSGSQALNGRVCFL